MKQFKHTNKANGILGFHTKRGFISLRPGESIVLDEKKEYDYVHVVELEQKEEEQPIKKFKRR